VFYDANGREMQAFDYSSDPEAQDFSSCCFNPSGDTAVVGAFNRFYVYSLNSSRGTWEQVGVKQVGVQCSVWKCMLNGCKVSEARR
jgi:intraflagellar transport protein 172